MHRVLVLIALMIFALSVSPAQAAGQHLRHAGADFLEGTLDGLALDPHGQLALAPVVTSRWSTESLYAWCLTLDAKGRLIVGTGDGGKLFRQDGDELVEFASTLALEMLSVMPWEDGVLAGSSPDGVVYQVGGDGDVRVALDLPQQSVWALAPGSRSGTWLAGTGPGARVLRGGRGVEAGELLHRIPATNTTVLVRDAEGLWIGTQGPGLVWRVRGDDNGDLVLVHEAPQPEIAAILPDGEGGAYVLSVEALAGDEAGSRLVYLPARGAAEEIWSGPERLLDLVATADGAFLAGEAETGRILRIDRQGRMGLWTEVEPADPLAMLVAGDETWVATGNLGAVFRLEAGRSEAGTYESSVIPTPRAETLGRLWVEGWGEAARYQVRSGLREVPDDTWSDWSEAVEAGASMPTPVGEYLQYRLLVEESVVLAVNLAWRERNLPPSIRTIKVEAMGGDLFGGGLSGGAAPVSQRFDDGLGVEYSFSPPPTPQDPDKVAWARGVRTIVWLATDPNEDRLLFDVHVKRWPDGEWIELAHEVEDRVLAWDTRALGDGNYRVRVIANDGGDHPVGEARSGELIGPVVRIDNTAPVFDKVSFDDEVLRCEVEDVGTRVDAIDLHTGDGKWRPLAVVDGVLDAPYERATWDFTGADMPAVVWLRAVDAAGNVTLREFRPERRR